jgi:hypothetical protein
MKRASCTVCPMQIPSTPITLDDLTLLEYVLAGLPTKSTLTLDLSAAALCVEAAAEARSTRTIPLVWDDAHLLTPPCEVHVLAALRAHPDLVRQAIDTVTAEFVDNDLADPLIRHDLERLRNLLDRMAPRSTRSSKSHSEHVIHA